MTRRTFALSLAASTVFAAETAKERGKRMIDKMISALGGDAFRNMKTRTEIGRAYSFYREQLSGLAVARMYTKYLPPSAEPGVSELQRQVFGKKLDEAVLFTATDAYDVTYRGAKPLGDERMNQFRDTTLHDIFYILHQRLDEPGIEFEARGADVIENQPVEAVEIFDAQNRSVTVWVNSTTFLPAKQRFYRWDATIKDRREEVTRFSKYRDAGNGVMWPYDTERERDTEKIFQLFAEKVTINESLPANMFELPNGVKVLKK